MEEERKASVLTQESTTRHTLERQRRSGRIETTDDRRTMPVQNAHS